MENQYENQNDNQQENHYDNQYDDQYANQYVNRQMYPYPYFYQPSPEEQYKRDLKKTAGKAALLLFILGLGGNILSSLISIIYTSFATLIEALKGGSSGNFNVMELVSADNGMYVFFVSLLPMLLMDIIIIFVARKLLNMPLRSLFVKTQTGVVGNAVGIVVCIATGATASVLASLYMMLFDMLGITIPSPPLDISNEQPLPTVFTLVYICLLGPILEEIIFRGFFLKSLQKNGAWFAILFTSILFSLFHCNLVQFLPPFFMGVVLSILTVKADSIVPAIIAHIANNSLAMLLSYLFPEDSPYYDMMNNIYAVVGVIIFAVALLLYWNRLKQISKGDETYMKTGKKLKTAFSSGWSVGYLIFYGVIVIGNIVIFTLTDLLKGYLQ